jgi:hypothetical protein
VARSNWFCDSVTPTHCAPAAADIEQALPRLQLDLGENVVDFLDLRGGEIFIAILEVRTRVNHILVEP